MWDERDVVRVGDENRIDLTLQASENVGTKVIDGTNEVLAAHEQIGEEEAHDDRADPRSNKACEGLAMIRQSFDEYIPSTVFFGEILMSWVLPNVIPQM